MRLQTRIYLLCGMALSVGAGAAIYLVFVLSSATSTCDAEQLTAHSARLKQVVRSLSDDERYRSGSLIPVSLNVSIRGFSRIPATERSCA